MVKNNSHKLLILGGGVFCSEIIDTLQEARCTVDGVDIHINTISVICDEDHPLKVGSDKDLSLLFLKYDFAFVAVGNLLIRKKLQCMLVGLGFKLPSIVHNSSSVSSSISIGSGSCILRNAAIGTNTVIGKGVIINVGASVTYSCNIGNYSHIGPGAVLCSKCTVGECTLVGAGSTLIPNTYVTDYCIIGAGAVVITNINTTGKLYVGVPAILKGDVKWE
jgi:sugar O-acyltransferase (sialic acid O-acetyltransferase NeuD family)